MNKLRDYFHKNRLINMAVFGILFAVLGYLIPQVFYQYIDRTEYVKYEGKITFDKQVYAPCEVQLATTRRKSTVDVPLKISSRLYLYTVTADRYEVIKEFSYETFIKSTEEVQELTTPTTLDCELDEGKYFYRGVSTYKIRGIEKTAGFESEVFEIEIPD